MRPAGLDDVVGQAHLLAPGKPLGEAIRSGQLHSQIYWGPPGCGKTTLARIAAAAADASLVEISAVLSGVKEIRAAIDRARQLRAEGRGAVVFVDEVHRFNKSQQDAFLPHVESGLFTFIGATTENPSFEVNNALLSRARVYVLQALDEGSLIECMARALDRDGELSGRRISLEPEAAALLARAADGDVRRALNLLEMACGLIDDGTAIDADLAATVAGDGVRRFDKGGDAFYDQISALHKTVRNSHPDAALYWLARMLDGGADPRYLARRIVRMASEDIGNADPRALTLALAAAQTYERLGSPEGELALAQAVVFLAMAPKSNAVYAAFKQAIDDVRNEASHDVPKHLRNAPTDLMKDLGHGADYRYDHDHEGGFAPTQTGFPDELGEREYYHPTDRGLEKQTAEKLTWHREQRRNAGS